MDYRDLFVRYLKLVWDYEGTTFLDEPDAAFTEEEWRELQAMAEEAKRLSEEDL